MFTSFGVLADCVLNNSSGYSVFVDRLMHGNGLLVYLASISTVGRCSEVLPISCSHDCEHFSVQFNCGGTLKCCVMFGFVSLEI